MSIVFNPSDVFIRPEYTDGLTNTITRQGRTTTSSLSLVTLAQIDLIPGLFSTVPNISLEFDIYGRFIGAAGNKTFTISMDGTTTLLSTGSLALSNLGYYATGRIYFDGTNLLWRINFNTVNFPSTFGGLGNQNSGLNNNLAFDPSISHSLLFRALVANGADSVTVEALSGSIR